MKFIINESIKSNDKLADNDVTIDEDANEVDQTIDNNINQQFNRRSNVERRRDMNIDLYNIINNIEKKNNYIRLRLLRYFANETYKKKNDDRSTSCCFECNELFKTLTDFHKNLQSPTVYENAIYIF